MKLRPVKSHILARFYNPPEKLIKTASKALSGEHRTIIEVVAVGPDVVTCKVGEFVWLKPATTPLAIDEAEELGVFDDSHVLGVVEDDKAPLTIVE